MSWFNDDLDRIDAAVFSGDALESFDNRKELKAMCERWLRAVAEREVQRCDSCGYQHGHQIGCDQNPVDIALRATPAVPT